LNSLLLHSEFKKIHMSKYFIIIIYLFVNQNISTLNGQIFLDIDQIRKSKLLNSDTMSFKPKRVENTTSTNFREFYGKRYNAFCLTDIVTNDVGNGNSFLYGTRNMRPVLPGYLYRAGANNFFHKTAQRSNNNPFPEDAIVNLYKEGFSTIVSLQGNNFPYSFGSNQRNNFTFYYGLNTIDESYKQFELLRIVHQNILQKNSGPILVHDWNGWEKVGYFSAIALKQFCNFSDDQAVLYWSITAEGGSRGFKYIKDSIRKFTPYTDLTLSEEIQAKICPCFDYDSKSLNQLVSKKRLNADSLMFWQEVHLYFDSQSTTIDLTSKNGLLQLITLLKKYPFIHIDLEGHSDNKEQNPNTLAKLRVMNVRNFILSQGIDSMRISTDVLGHSLPHESNQNSYGRKINRRVELKFQMFTPDIQFNENFEISASTQKELNSIAFLLQRLGNENIGLQIFSHVYNVKDSTYNKQLTEKISSKIYEFLMLQSIDSSRLDHIGAGAEYPIANNNDLKDRNRNSRVEFMLYELEAVGVVKPTKLKEYRRPNLRLVSPDFYNKIVHVVTTGQTLKSIASQYRVTVSDLKYWNNIYKKKKLKKGKKLVVYQMRRELSIKTLVNDSISNDSITNELIKTDVNENSDNENSMSNSTMKKDSVQTILKEIEKKEKVKTNTSDKNAKKSTKKLIINGYICHKVKSGDNLWTLAKRYGVTYQDILDENGLKKEDKLHLGQILKIKKE